MTNTDALQDLLEPQDLTTAQVHDLLHELENHLGRRPEQIVADPLLVRWISRSGDSPTDGDMIEIALLTPTVNNDEIVWYTKGTHDSSLDELEAEYRDLKHPDAEGGENTPYYYNICTGDREKWEHGFLPHLNTWWDFERAISSLISEVSVNLAAIPPDWFDAGIGMSIDTIPVAVEAHRDVLTVAIPAFDLPKEQALHVFQFTPEAALQCGQYVTQTIMGGLGPTWTVGHLDLNLSSLDYESNPVDGVVSAFMDEEEAEELEIELDVLGERSETELRFAELIDLASAHEIARSEEELLALFQPEPEQ